MGAVHKIRIFEGEVQPVRIDELRIDEETLQSRAGTDEDIVRIYAERRRGKPKQPGTPFPPVLVYLIAGIYWLTDGFHRVRAAMKLGEETIPAIIRKADSLLDALLAGAEINMSKENLRGYQEDDRRRLTEMLIKYGAGKPKEGSWDWPDMQIANRSGLNAGTIRKIRLQLQSSEGIPLPDRIVRFIDGKPSDKTQPYVLKKAGVPSLSFSKSHKRGSRPNFTACIDGKMRSFGTDEQKAKEALDSFLEQRFESSHFLSGSQPFIKWLASYRILATSPTRDECPFSITIVEDTACYPVGDPTYENFLMAIARLVLWSGANPGKSLFVVGYCQGAHPRITRTIPWAETIGIRFVTPEEILDKFGPKGDQPA